MKSGLSARGSIALKRRQRGTETRDDAGEPGKCPLSERSQTQNAPRRVLPLVGEVGTGGPAEARG